MWCKTRISYLQKNICFGTHWKHLFEVLLMSTHKICFHKEIRKQYLPATHSYGAMYQSSLRTLFNLYMHFYLFIVAPALAGRLRHASFCPFIRLSVFPSICASIHTFVFPSTFTLGVLWAQLLLQFCTDHFETLHVFSSWYEDVYVVWI